MASNKKSGRGGFSLTEVMVAVSVAVTLLGIAVPTETSFDLAGAEARRLVADGMLARSRARTQWEGTMVEVDVLNNRWRVQTLDGEIIPGSDADDDGWRHLAEGVRFRKRTTVDPTFIFLPNGRTFRAASVVLSTGETAWEVSANALSGKINSGPTEVPDWPDWMDDGHGGDDNGSGDSASGDEDDHDYDGEVENDYDDDETDYGCGRDGRGGCRRQRGGQCRRGSVHSHDHGGLARNQGDGCHES